MRTALGNLIPGLIGEFGFVVPHSLERISPCLVKSLDDGENVMLVSVHNPLVRRWFSCASI